MLFLRWKVHYAKEALLLVNNLRISWGVLEKQQYPEGKNEIF